MNVLHCKTMVRYTEDVGKALKKGLMPRDVFRRIHEALEAVDATKNLSLFDIRQLKVSGETGREYFRLRKGKYRAVFFIENDDLVVMALGKREEVYREWQ